MKFSSRQDWKKFLISIFCCLPGVSKFPTDLLHMPSAHMRVPWGAPEIKKVLESEEGTLSLEKKMQALYATCFSLFQNIKELFHWGFVTCIEPWKNVQE